MKYIDADKIKAEIKRIMAEEMEMFSEQCQGGEEPKLHRYNAIHRIKEHKEQFDPLTIPDLYHVAEYYKSVGAEITCCCLQSYCMDFRFDQEDVREIISKEG